jgi:integration host factor subunit beta
MNKIELIQALKDIADLSRSEAAAVVDIFFDRMSYKLAN